MFVITPPMFVITLVRDAVRRAAFLGRLVADVCDRAGRLRLRTHTLGAAACLMRAEGARHLLAS